MITTKRCDLFHAGCNVYAVTSCALALVVVHPRSLFSEKVLGYFGTPEGEGRELVGFGLQKLVEQVPTRFGFVVLVGTVTSPGWE